VAVFEGVLVPARGSASDAAAELFAAEYPRLAGWCRGLVGDEQAAHDLAAEAFARLWSRWTHVDDPRGYLYVVATNLVRRHWRRAADGPTELGSDVGAGVDGPDMTVRDLVERLPKRLRAVVLLHYYADLPVARVAWLLDRPQGSIKSDLHRARQLLAAALEAQP
jgi:RNA polymerase sigma-70 factor (ECF subfamily)